MEKDDEVKGEGNSLDFGARIYDSRLGRWFSVDKVFDAFPSYSPYNYAINNPIYWVDTDGRIITPPPAGTDARIAYDVFVYNADPETKARLARLDADQNVNYVIQINKDLMGQKSDIQWQNTYNDDGIQQINVVVSVDAKSSFEEQINQAQSELGKATVEADLFRGGEIGFTLPNGNEQTEKSGLDAGDVAAIQEGGIKGAKNNDVPITGSAKDYNVKVASGKQSSAEWVSKYKENKTKVYKDAVTKSSGKEGLKSGVSIQGYQTGKAVDKHVSSQEQNYQIRGYFFKRGGAGNNKQNDENKNIIKTRINNN